ncbi:ShET2/EspL2 family type III secretion system effector toxin, partial [Candidatus Ichthyocystis sparus]|uniref:ShET2/EspL2 family type III secretion system effector toxin n=1 Tax=Candidatus Ichthyocystis sparus TaxID=1561004 RepID=UPI0027D22D66
MCDKFGDFLHRTASTMISGEQRLFTLHSCSHVMSFKIVRKTKEIEGVSADRWVVHFFDPNITTVVARSEVLSCEEFLDQSKFSLRMFIYQGFYGKYYFEVNPGFIESECAVYEYSDTREASSNFSTLDALSQDGISGCMMFHIMSNNIYSLDIREIARSKSFSTLSASARRDVFFAKSSGGVPGLFFAISENHYNAVKSYIDFLEELSSDEQLSLLPRIIRSESPEGVPSLFIAMQENNIQSINAFYSLIDRLMNIRSRMHIDDFCNVLFDILLARRGDGLSALSMALLSNNAEAIHAFGGFLDRIFMLKGDISSRRLADMIFNLLDHKDIQKNSALLYGLRYGCSNAVRAFGALLDRLLFMKGDIPDADVADMVYNLINPSCDGDYGLFLALQSCCADTVLALVELVSSKFMLLSSCLSESSFNFMMLRILSAMNTDNTPGIFVSFSKNDTGVIDAYNSLLLYAPKGVRKEIFCIKDSDGSPAIYRFIECNKPESFLAYDYFLQLLSCDEQVELIPELLSSKNEDSGCGAPALFLAMKEGRDSCIDAYSTLMEKQLMKIRERMSNDDFANLIFNIALAKGSNGISALYMGMYRDRSGSIIAYSILLGKVLVLLRGTVPDDKIARLIFELLKSRTSDGYDGLFVTLQQGNSDVVLSFGLLLDIFVVLKGCIEDTTLVGMVFDLLMCKSGDDNIPGLFEAMKNGHHRAVEAFVELLEKFMMFKDDISTGYFNSMLLDLVASRRPDGVSGLFVALENDFPEVIKSYTSLIKLIPKDELASVLVAPNGSGVPAALLAGSNALEAYFAMVFEFPTKTIYALHSQLSSARRLIEHILAGDRDLEGKYKFLLGKIKE